MASASGSSFDRVCDIVVVGAGGGLVGALAARDAGEDVIVVEKSGVAGGSTALSGGTLWVFANSVARAAGLPDTVEKGIDHLKSIVPEGYPSASPARIEAYVRESASLVDLLQKHGTALQFSGWTDYYAEATGGFVRGRTLHAAPIAQHDLGEWASWLRPTRLFLSANSVEVAKLALGARSVSTALVSVRVLARDLWARARRVKLLTRGQALMGRILRAAMRNGVTLWRNTPLVDLIVENGAVVGVSVMRENKLYRIGARKGVLLSAGGFARNETLRRMHQSPVGVDVTMSAPEDTGDAILVGEKHGAATALMEEAWWVPGTKPPGGPMLHVWDRCFPHSLVVDTTGRRYLNEAGPYMEAGQAMMRRHRELGTDHSWLILESRHRNRYAFGLALPRITPAEWLKTGYVKKADTLDDLAAAIGVDIGTLRGTVERFNAMVATGRDEDFGRGESSYSRFYSDTRVKPNGNLGAIERGPFYAIALYPGDVGTAGGLLTDEYARVLDVQNNPIPGLYAAGNNSASVFGPIYPGAGASIAASMIFSMIASRHMAAKRGAEIDTPPEKMMQVAS
jgi:3-oxosteroid 1-dehydrogenase